MGSLRRRRSPIIGSLLTSLWLSVALAAPTLAVADLENASFAPELEPAGPAATGMLLSRFSRVDDVQLVERKHLEAVLDELQLSSSGLVSPDAAVEAGRLLGADYLAFGEVTSVLPGQITLHLRVVETATARIVVSEDVSGSLVGEGRDFVDLVDTLAERIVVGLQLELSPEEERAIKTLEQRELDALAEWGGVPSSSDDADAVPSCDLAEGQSHPANLPKTGSQTLSGLRRGSLSADAAATCLALLEAHLASDDLTRLYDTVLKLAVRDIKRDAPAGILLTEALGKRQPGLTLSPRGVAKARKRLGRLDSPVARDLLRVLSLDVGVLDGEPVTSASIDTVDPGLLLLLAQRLPSAELRDAAATRLVELRVASSPHPLVTNNAEAATRSVLEYGYWPLPASAEVTELLWSPKPMEPASLLVKARPASSSALIQGQTSGGERVAPRWSLTSLTATVEGMASPVELCPPREPLDPTPCIAPDALTLDDPWAVLTPTHLSMLGALGVDDVVKLGRSGPTLSPPVTLGSATLDTLEVPVVFERVRPMTLHGYSEQPGPDVQVDIYEISNGRVLVGVKNEQTGERQAAVVALDDERFVAGSVGGRGATGAAGADGADGADGAKGIDASCDRKGGPGGDGEDGADGEDGQPGGPGADGGDVTVTVHCGESCRDLIRFAETHVSSQGGSGGFGGRPGRGGNGGNGGSAGDSYWCEVYNASLDRTEKKHMTGGMSGLPGQLGTAGKAGPSGPDGAPGGVTINVKR